MKLLGEVLKGLERVDVGEKCFGIIEGREFGLGRLGKSFVLEEVNELEIWEVCGSGDGDGEVWWKLGKVLKWVVKLVIVVFE